MTVSVTWLKHEYLCHVMVGLQMEANPTMPQIYTIL